MFSFFLWIGLTLAMLRLSGNCEISKDRFMIWEIGLESMLLHAMISLGDLLSEPAELRGLHFLISSLISCESVGYKKKLIGFSFFKVSLKELGAQ